MSAKKFSIIFIAFIYLGSLFCLVLLGILIYLYDPLQAYHKPFFREPSFSSDMRIQNKGIIKHYDFDSFIIGTSMLRNTSANEAVARLGGKWVNISMDGSAFNERAVVLGYLFKTKNVKQIIGSLDGHSWLGEANTKHFAFLYDGVEFNDIRVYFNKKIILCALNFSKNQECVGEKDLETLTNWAKDKGNSSRFGGLNKWLENKDNGQIKDTLAKLQALAKAQTLPTYDFKPHTNSIKSSQEMLEKNVLRFVRQNPNTKFHFVFPTYSRLSYRLDNNATGYAKTKIVLKWLVSEAQNLPNMKIYGFDDLTYADEIANYKDLTHYNVDMNSMQLDAIASGTHILTPQNIDAYLATMEAKIKAYDLTPLINEIKAWEMEQNKSKNKQNE